MKQFGRSLVMARLRSAVLFTTLALPLAVACATGLDVTDDELQRVCADDPTLDCEGTGAAVGGSSPGAGGSGNPIVTNGGTSNLPSNGGSGSTPLPNNGGSTSTAQGGSGGTTPTGIGGTNQGPITGGNCTSIVTPVAAGTCAAAPTATIDYSDTSNGASTNELKMDIGLTSTTPINLTDLVIRYWFTANGQTDFQGELFYATLGDGADIKGTMCIGFGDQLSSQFADIAFTSGGSANSVQTIQFRLYPSNYGQMDQADDFSYVAGGANVPNPNISVYVAGQLVGGCEPGGTAP